MISCRDAGKVAERFLKALHVAGGAPRAGSRGARARHDGAAGSCRRRTSPSMLRATSSRAPASSGKGGRADYTVYSKMRFPLLDAPAYANSQSFMNLGNCDSTGRVSVGMAGLIPTYRCRVGGTTLLKDEAAAGNYAYPWRDNFCEHRAFDVGQCPGGFGHQGQDIRPSSCKQRFARRRLRALSARRGGGARRHGAALARPDAGLPVRECAGRAHPLPLPAHVSAAARRRRGAKRPRRSRRARYSARSATSSSTSARPPITCISTCRCRPSTAGFSSIPI